MSMPAPYSYDLRKKAIAAVKKGERNINLCLMWQISRNTLDLWLKREKETVHVKAITNGGRPQKIKDQEKFREFLRENNEMTQKQMAKLWGDNVTQQNISYFCQKLGITRKKNLWLSREGISEKVKLGRFITGRANYQLDGCFNELRAWRGAVISDQGILNTGPITAPLHALNLSSAPISLFLTYFLEMMKQEQNL